MTAPPPEGAMPPAVPRGPWDQPTVAAPPAQRPASPLAEIGWAIVSTALLAAWLGWQMGWVWALAGVVGVFVHEFGHLLVINALGSGPSRIRIIPFLGGAATMARPPNTDFKGVLIALAGPIFGLIAVIPFVLLLVITGSSIWREGIFFIALINLLNLAPVQPLDGSKALGPALARIHPMLERVVVVLLGAVAVYLAIRTGNWIIAAFVGIASLGALRNGVQRAPARPLTLGEWAASVALWLIALGLCLAVLAAFFPFRGLK